MFEKRILNIYSIIIGALFIISGIGKVIDTAAFSTLIYQYGLGYSMILAPLIVIIEILLGMLLILLINPKRYSMISFFLLIIFTISFAFAHFRNGINDCGCFGTIQHTNLPPIYTFLRNFILIVMSLVIWIKYPKEKTETEKWKKNLLLVVMCPVIFISGFTFILPPFMKSSPEKNKFKNQNIKNTELAKYVKTSPDSTYLIFCFSYTCPHCLNSIENFRQYKKSNTVNNIISLGTGSDSSRINFEKNFNPDFYIKNLSGEEMNKLTDAYPTAYYIKHDSIKAVIKGELPSFVIFKKQYSL